jgi:BCD family chlorophyll transporter-like MFS transporter
MRGSNAPVTPDGDGARGRKKQSLALAWRQIGLRFLPFADAVSTELPLGRLLRLSLFQLSVGLALVLLNGTLNRVMIVELGVPASLVALMVSLPLLFAPARALVGFRSDHHRSYLGWRRVPYIWMGTLLQFGGLAIMPFALLVLSGDTHGPVVFGQIGAALAFLLIGAGLHTSQTAGLALATDLAPEATRPRVVALLYVMLLVGMVVSAAIFGRLLENYSQFRLIGVIQGSALLTMALNVVALWKQEARQPRLTSPELHRDKPRATFLDAWRSLVAAAPATPGAASITRFLVTVGLGTAAFSMQDILLEPFGGQVLKLGVGATTALTAILAGGSLAAFALSAGHLGRGGDPYRLSAWGALVGVCAFMLVLFAAPLNSVLLFRIGTALIGFGAGLFAVGTLTAAMAFSVNGAAGLALGAWGAVQATAAGLGIALGGVIRDTVSGLAAAGSLGPALTDAAVGYSAVYQLEVVLLFATLAAVGPLVRRVTAGAAATVPPRFGMAEFPG